MNDEKLGHIASTIHKLSIGFFILAALGMPATFAAAYVESSSSIFFFIVSFVAIIIGGVLNGVRTGFQVYSRREEIQDFFHKEEEKFLKGDPDV